MTVHEKVAAALQEAGSETPVTWRASSKGGASGWCALSDPALLLPVGRALAALEARFCALSGYLCDGEGGEAAREVAYHFDLDGVTFTVTLRLPVEGACLPSLTPIFRGALWSERELMELYRIEVAGHPDPRRLFLDEALDGAPLERLVPYSTMVNAANARIWEGDRQLFDPQKVACPPLLGRSEL